MKGGGGGGVQSNQIFTPKALAMSFFFKLIKKKGGGGGGKQANIAYRDCIIYGPYVWRTNKLKVDSPNPDLLMSPYISYIWLSFHMGK